MKKFLIKSFWFIFPILVSAYPLDLLISHNLRKTKDNFGDREVWKDIYEGKANCEIAIYGSSRAAVHINSKILENFLHKSAYNFGIGGQNFPLQYFEHNQILKQNIKPQIIILSLDSLTFVEKKSIFESNQFLPYLLFNEQFRKYFHKYNNFGISDFYLPLNR